MEETLKAREARHAERIERARRQHDEHERRRKEEIDAHNAVAQRLRGAEVRGDPEPLAELLESELSNEELPTPLVFDIVFASIHEVAIELALPDFDVVPEERTQLTKTGKLSLRALPQRDRVAIYIDLCTGLALRLVYETFRVLPMVRIVEVFGTVEGSDPATGHPTEYVVLHITTSRDALSELNLDGVDPSAAFERLVGRFACNRSGELHPLPGVSSLPS